MLLRLVCKSQPTTTRLSAGGAQALWPVLSFWRLVLLLFCRQHSSHNMPPCVPGYLADSSWTTVLCCVQVTAVLC